MKMMPIDLVAARVTANPQVRSGQPIIRGTRITVWDILGWLGGGMSEAEVLEDYPELSTDDIKAALQYAYQLKYKVSHTVKLLFDAKEFRGSLDNQKGAD